MFLLVTLIHAIFASIFFFFDRPIEMGVIIFIYVIFISKIIPPLDVFRRPEFLKSKTPVNKTLEQSIYISSGILFYTALMGVSLGVTNALGIPVNLHILYYCIFFLTGVIYGIYLLFYPKNQNVFILFRTHTLIAGLILSLLVFASTLFHTFAIEILLLVNLMLIVAGYVMVILFDRTISKTNHILHIYSLIVGFIALIVGILSLFHVGFPVYILVLLIALAALYIFFPSIIANKTFKEEHIPILKWHFTNCILGISWAIFGYLFWALFWGFVGDRMIIIFSLFILLGLWFWVYGTDERNPLFFTGMIVVVATLYSFVTFVVFPPLFWSITTCLFVFSSGMLLLGRVFRGTTEELILSGSTVIFLCLTDIVLIFQYQHLFGLSALFFFQSFLWYGAYEVFHRHSHAKNEAL